MMTEEELSKKYDDGTPWWRRDAIERYVCEKHGRPTIFIRDHDIVVHADSDTECC